METEGLIMPGRIVVRVVLINGNEWVTPINTDFAGACNYYFGAGGFEQPDGSVSRVSRVIQLDSDDRVVRVMTASEFFGDFI
jgi:hypothetical protein